MTKRPREDAGDEANGPGSFPSCNRELKSGGKLDRQDYLYHLGLCTKTQDLRAMFGDVKLVCMQGSGARAEHFAEMLANQFGIEGPVKPLGKQERCRLFKVGPVVSMSHGMGMPSILIFLHEMAKLLVHAGCDMKSVEWVRIGTSGGIGVAPGTVVISKEVYDATLQPGYQHVSLGQVKRWPAHSDLALMERIREAGAEVECAHGEVHVVVGDTMCTDDFYEGQGRLDGAFQPWYDEEEKLRFLQRAHDKGVRNIEMESQCFLAFCNRLNAGPGVVICVTLLNRLEGDQITSTPEQLVAYTDRALSVMLRYTRRRFPTLCVAEA